MLDFCIFNRPIIHFLSSTGYLFTPTKRRNQFRRHRVPHLPADIGTERHAVADDVVPIGFGQAVQVRTADTVPQQTVHHPGIEVVARPDGAHRLNRRNRVALPEIARKQPHVFSGIRTDEMLAVESYPLGVYFLRIGLTEHVTEVFGRAALR